MTQTAGALRSLLLVLVFAVGALVGASSSARADRWICPECPASIIERSGTEKLACPVCGQSWSVAELSPAVMYINSRTRDAETAWVAESDNCELFRLDGMRVWAAEKQDLWVPWIAVDYFIPRFEKVRLLDGREFDTDYPKGPTCQEPPLFSFEVQDSVNILGHDRDVRKLQMQEDLSTLFLVASSPEGRDSARVRFIHEVEAGMHPRLPRTHARLTRAAHVNFPTDPSVAGKKGESILEVRLSDRGGILRVRSIKSSGVRQFEDEAARVAMTSGYQHGGEMGVGCPSSVRLHFVFDGKTATVTEEDAVPGFWDDY